MCCRWLRCCFWWMSWLFRCCFCCPRRYVYLLDPENGVSTRKFAKEFQYFVDWSIKFVHVKSSCDCVNDCPVALLSRRITDRAGEDMQSILKNIDEDLYARTALINIHVVENTSYLPKVPTAEKVSNFQDLGIILDFGLMDRNIYVCNYMGKKDSKQAFECFIRNRKPYKNSTGPNYKTFS